MKCELTMPTTPDYQPVPCFVLFVTLWITNGIAQMAFVMKSKVN
jgi:hypothetical protein